MPQPRQLRFLFIVTSFTSGRLARRGGACPRFLAGRPGLGGPGSPGPGALDASARASRRATAASFRFRVLRRPDPRHGASSTPRRLPGGRPGTWLRATHAGAASRPTSTTPRPKRPSVDGTARTHSEIHPRCQEPAQNDHIAIISAPDPLEMPREFFRTDDTRMGRQTSLRNLRKLDCAAPPDDRLPRAR